MPLKRYMQETGFIPSLSDSNVLQMTPGHGEPWIETPQSNAGIRKTKIVLIVAYI